MYKPVILIGNGYRYNDLILYVLKNLQIPILTTWMAMDMLPEDHPAFCGRPGMLGQRAANIIISKADTLFIYGARLDMATVAHSYANFAPYAEKYIFEIDDAELDKLPKEYHKFPKSPFLVTAPEWLAWCKSLYARFRPELDNLGTTSGVDPLRFMAHLSELAQPGDLLAVGSSGQAVEAFMQTFKVKVGQRVTNLSTIGAMGADIPMAIGACIASGKKPTICVTGDGGFALNTPALEIVRRLKLPIKFFVFSNGGYGSIAAMQDARFEGRHVGCDSASGLTLTPLENIARAHGLRYAALEDPQFDRINYVVTGGIVAHQDNWKQTMTMLLDGNYPGACICEVHCQPWVQYPRVMSQGFTPDRYEDMTPKLDPAELKAIMEYGND